MSVYVQQKKAFFYSMATQNTLQTKNNAKKSAHKKSGKTKPFFFRMQS
jgi:hypothetical protein